MTTKTSKVSKTLEVWAKEVLNENSTIGKILGKLRREADYIGKLKTHYNSIASSLSLPPISEILKSLS